MIEFLETVTNMITEKQKDSTGIKVKLSEKDILYKLLHMRDVLERWKIVGLNRKLQIKPRSWEEITDDKGETSVKCTEVQLILKWGGNLTKLGPSNGIVGLTGGGMVTRSRPGPVCAQPTKTSIRLR